MRVCRTSETVKPYEKSNAAVVLYVHMFTNERAEQGIDIEFHLTAPFKAPWCFWITSLDHLPGRLWGHRSQKRLTLICEVQMPPGLRVISLPRSSSPLNRAHPARQLNQKRCCLVETWTVNETRDGSQWTNVLPKINQHLQVSTLHQETNYELVKFWPCAVKKLVCLCF